MTGGGGGEKKKKGEKRGAGPLTFLHLTSEQILLISPVWGKKEGKGGKKEPNLIPLLIYFYSLPPNRGKRSIRHGREGRGRGKKKEGKKKRGRREN